MRCTGQEGCGGGEVAVRVTHLQPQHDLCTREKARAAARVCEGAEVRVSYLVRFGLGLGFGLGLVSGLVFGLVLGLVFGLG